MQTYCGRFAPSPTGELHFGSLITALGSFLRARSQKGFWHLRIEDIDFLRCKKIYSENILRCLDAFCLNIDGSILYQSQRLDLYEEVLSKLIKHNQTYGCDCSRSIIKANNGIHPAFCIEKKLPPVTPYAIRFINNSNITNFEDLIHGNISLNIKNEDFILKRHDGFFAYNLVSVIDDNITGITEIVRGNDLIIDTFKQISLMKALQYNIPKYIHLPLALDKNGLKISKQNHATPLNLNNAPELLKKALSFLGQPIPLGNNCSSIISEAINQFNYKKIPLENHLS